MMQITKVAAVKRVEDIIYRYEEARLADPDEYKYGIRIQVDEYTAECLKRLLRDALVKREDLT